MCTIRYLHVVNWTSNIPLPNVRFITNALADHVKENWKYVSLKSFCCHARTVEFARAILKLFQGRKRIFNFSINRHSNGS